MCALTHTRAGLQANRFACGFGLKLLPALLVLHPMHNPCPAKARDIQGELGVARREAGYTVWQA